jgi:hypothetical protein
LPAAPGTVVRAPELGRVLLVADASYGSERPRWSRPSGWSGYGPRIVVLRGASGAFHVLAHVARDTPAGIAPGVDVAEGALLGTVSARARHLHWEVRTSLHPPRGVEPFYVARDPVVWLTEGAAAPPARPTPRPAGVPAGETELV